ncbi:MAG: diacylglycerol kinase, partial [Marinilabiliales bacterium]
MTKKSENNKFSIKRRLQSFTYAFKGIVYALKSQHNLWIHLTASILVIVFGFYFQINSYEWFAVVLCIGFVISAEIFNSAIEALTDLASPDYNKKAGLVKDMAAGAVLISAIISAVIGLIVF